MNTIDINPTAAENQQLADIVEEIAVKLQAGEPCDVEHYAALHPEFANRLRDWVNVMSAMADLGHSRATSSSSLAARITSNEAQPSSTYRPTAGILGDFRIVRELGRGGMGIVYEAEQISLGRSVALKVLPFAAMLDRQQLARFKNEARAAATLDHPNIVSIFSVGVERGVHYYAMQLIEGRSLAEIIAAMKPGRPPTSDETASMADLANRSIAADTAKVALPTVQTDGGALSTSSPPTTSLPPFASREYFRAVASLGAQAAEALDHAHQNGILHRDIKPANLMLDETGKLWITDFGLARIERDAGLTMTGDLLGTVRYMSPEQALAKRVVVDHRSDIYSLGATLYELLALQPAFMGEDRQELLRQIAFDEPRKLRQLNAHIPADLETIVAKAIEKNPAERYGTAHDFAADLRRFVDDKPIRAKPPSRLTIVRKWSRRNQPIIWASATTLFLTTLVIAAATGWMAREQHIRHTVANAIATNALDDADQHVERSDWRSALVAAQRADDLLSGSNISGPLATRAGELVRDIQMVLKLEELALEGDFPTESRGAAYLNAEHSYSKLFRDYGVDVELLDRDVVASRIRASAIRLELASALDTWATWRRRSPGNLYPDKLGKPLIDLARLVDPDPERNRVRDALECVTTQARAKAYASLNLSIEDNFLPLRTALSLAAILNKHGNDAEALRVLRSAQTKYPSDFRVNALLANTLMLSEPPKTEEALQYYTAACALRPDNAGMHFGLGVVLSNAGRLDDAIVQFKRAIEIIPDLYLAHWRLGVLLLEQGRSKEAQPHLDLADRDSFTWEQKAGVCLRKKDFPGVTACLTKAIELDPQSPTILFLYRDRGIYHFESKQYQLAVDDFTRALQIHPADGIRVNRGIAYFELGEFQKSADDWSKVLEFQPVHPNRDSFLRNRAACNTKLNQHRQAIEDYEATITLVPDDHATMNNLASLLATSPEDDLRNGPRALELAKKACEVTQEKNASYLVTLAGAYAETGDFDSASRWAEKAVELSDPELREFFVERLESFRQKKPWREPYEGEIVGQ